MSLICVDSLFPLKYQIIELLQGREGRPQGMYMLVRRLGARRHVTCRRSLIRLFSYLRVYRAVHAQSFYCLIFPLSF